MTTLVLASDNLGKLGEFQSLFDQAHLAIHLVPQSDYQVSSADETGLSFVENAIIKARHASGVTKFAALADDSGLCVPVLGNFPGIYSARYASLNGRGNQGDDGANNQALLANLQPYFDKGETIEAFFVCVLALVRHKDDPLPMIAQGLWRGQLLKEPMGDNGFGYDPLFWLPTLNKTSAQLTKEEKNAMSHRGQALQELLKQLKDAPF